MYRISRLQMYRKYLVLYFVRSKLLSSKCQTNGDLRIKPLKTNGDLRRIYTTSIMTSPSDYAIVQYRKDKRSKYRLHRKEKTWQQLIVIISLIVNINQLHFLQQKSGVLISCAHLRISINEKIVFWILPQDRAYRTSQAKQINMFQRTAYLR